MKKKKIYDWVDAVDAKLDRILKENIEDGIVRRDELIGKHHRG